VSTVVVYVHGLWQRGTESLWLRRRLEQELHAEARAFSYPSVTAQIADSARNLAEALAAIRATTLHLVGHSLGGLMIMKAFEDGSLEPQLPPGRIVLLGPPLGGSRAARNLAAWPFGKVILGKVVREELLTHRQRRWAGGRPLGVIAGSLGFGIGRLTGPLGGPNDGTILVDETRLEGIADHLVLRVSHTGMLFAPAVARAAGVFLGTGRFGD
jgi:predicted alpha/beta hydrolase family esterase